VTTLTCNQWIKRNQIAINAVTNILLMSINMLISLWITPYLIHKLGLAAYSYVGLINNITTFMAVITLTLTSMVGRFVIVSLEKNGPQQASRYISSALFANIFLGAFLFLIILSFGFNLDRFINIQKEFDLDVKTAFIISGITFIITSISMIFACGAYSRNRLDITNGVYIFSNIIRVIILVLLFSLFNAKIWHISIASLLQISIALIGGIFVTRALQPDLRFDIKLFKFSMAFELLSSGIFNSMIVLGNNFITQIDLIVGNRYLPADLVGMYAAILLIPNSIRNIASALSQAFSPTTIKIYSSGNLATLRIYTNKVVKLCGLMIGWPIAIVSGLAIPILKIWLGRDYSPYQFMIILMVLPLTVNLAVHQLYIVQQAMNKVRVPAIAAILFGGMNVFLAVFLVKRFEMGLLGIVLSGVITSTLRSTVFIPIYTASITRQPIYSYYRGMISPILVSFVICMLGVTIQKFFPVNTLVSVLAAAFVLSVFYMVIFIGALDPEERANIKGRIISIMGRLNPRIVKNV